VNITKVSDVDAVWPLIAPQIVKCIEKTPSFMSAGDLWQMCRSGQAFLIIAHDDVKIHGAAIWQFQTAYNTTVFSCLMLVGEALDDWALSLLESARLIARGGGAMHLCATSRIGLVQKLKKLIPGLKVVRQSYLVEV